MLCILRSKPLEPLCEGLTSYIPRLCALLYRKLRILVGFVSGLVLCALPEYKWFLKKKKKGYHKFGFFFFFKKKKGYHKLKKPGKPRKPHDFFPTS